MIRIINIDQQKERNVQQRKTDAGIVLSYDCEATAAYGMGERFDGVDRMGKRTECAVIEKFTRQGAYTYFPIPFFFCNDGHGVFVDTSYAVTFTLTLGHVQIEIPAEECSVTFYHGTPKEMIAAFVRKTGAASLPPKWAFGPWASANRWNKQRDIEEELEQIKRHKYPATVLVIEAWSDEATFYIWNGAQYKAKPAEQFFTADDFKFGEPWPSPQDMIDALHDAGIHIVLWQIPALKQLEAGEQCPQHDADDAYAIEQGYVVKNPDGTPYRIPKQWFIGAHVPDFTNPAAQAWWMQKRQYLLDMGVDGFKTDGGEFIHDPAVMFDNGRDGYAMRNAYPAVYEKTYADAIGRQRVLFSRAGYTGGQNTPIHWAGDQVSTFAELRAVLGAGLSLGLSGVPFWGFDIAGFAGEFPSAELYLRATALAAFAPVMQWHSETLGGQYGGSESGDVNDRSPWNVAARTNSARVLSVAGFYARLRMNLLPELYRQARIAAETGAPMMRHMVYDYPDDPAACACHDAFMLGDLLVAPVLEEGSRRRSVYLPSGEWYDFLAGAMTKGGRSITVNADAEQIPVFLRSPGAVALNLGCGLTLGSDVGNRTDAYQNLVFCVAGAANYEFFDDMGTHIMIKNGKAEQPATLIHPDCLRLPNSGGAS